MSGSGICCIHLQCSIQDGRGMLWESKITLMRTRGRNPVVHAGAVSCGGSWLKASGCNLHSASLDFPNHPRASALPDQTCSPSAVPRFTSSPREALRALWRRIALLHTLAVDSKRGIVNSGRQQTPQLSHRWHRSAALPALSLLPPPPTPVVALPQLGTLLVALIPQVLSATDLLFSLSCGRG